MANKTLLSSFILLSISIVFSIISLVYFNLFNLDILNSVSVQGCPSIYPNNCYNYMYYILNSNIQMHFFPGFIFYGISLLLTIAGIVAFIINFIRKKPINKEQIDKEKKIGNNKNTGLLKNSLIIFGIIIAALLPISLLNLKFQYDNFLGLIYCIIVGVILIISDFFRKRAINKKNIIKERKNDNDIDLSIWEDNEEHFDKKIKNDKNSSLSKSEEQIDKEIKDNEDIGILINLVFIFVIVFAAFFSISLFAIVGAVAGIILFIANIFRQRAISKERIDKETISDKKTGLLKNSFIVFVVVIALSLISLVYFIRFQGIIPNTPTTLTYSPFIGKLIHVFNPVDIYVFIHAVYSLKISVILSLIGIIVFTIGILKKNIIKPQKGV